jgi:putative ABC transport system permease protein
LALVLAAVGLYGVSAHAVGERVREIGVRMALGAHASDVIMLVSRDTLLTVAAGALSGPVLAAILAHAAAGLLFEVSPREPLVYVVTLACLVGAALAGVLLPGRRALRINRVRALCG